MRISYVLTAATLLTAGAVLHRSAALQSASLAPRAGQDLILLERAPASQLPLWLEWFSLRNRVVVGHTPPGEGPAGGQVEYLAHDALTWPAAELAAALDALPAALPDAPLAAAVRRPRDETLLMSWDPATTLVEFHAGHILDPSERAGAARSTLSMHEQGWAKNAVKPRSEFAPQWKSWFLSLYTEDPHHAGFRNGQVATGTGFAKVLHTGEAVFAVDAAAAKALLTGQELEAPPADSLLVVAREPGGRHWLWFERDPSRP